MLTLIALLLGSSLAAAAMSLTSPARRPLARRIFCNIWLMLCLVSLRSSVAHGRPLIGEIPVHVLLFLLPAAVTFRFVPRVPASPAV